MVVKPGSSVRRGAIVSSVATLMGVQLMLAPEAWAINFGSTSCGGDPRNCVSLADNAYHSWYPSGKLGNQISGIDTATRSSMADYDYWTDLNTVEHSQSGDVIVGDYNYGFNGAVAWVECRPASQTWGSHPDLRCDNQALRYNADYLSYYSTFTERKSIACEEIGHTVGLQHRYTDNSCMAQDSTITYTSLHDDGHINNYY